MTDRDKEVSRPQKLVDDLWRECLRHRNAIYNGPSSDRPIAIANALRIATAALHIESKHPFDGGDECLNCGNPWKHGECVLNGCESDE